MKKVNLYCWKIFGKYWNPRWTELAGVDSVVINAVREIIVNMTNLHPLKYIVLLLLSILASQLVTAQTESELLQQLRADYYSLIDLMEEYELAGEDYRMNASERDDYSNWINQLREQFTKTCYAFSRQPNLQISPDNDAFHH